MSPAKQPAIASPIVVTIVRLHNNVLLHIYKQQVARLQDTFYWCV
jgi:serine/threonine protein kinase